MDEIWIRLGFTALGLIVGYIIGTVRAAMVFSRDAAEDAHHTRETIERMEHDGVHLHRDEQGYVDFNEWLHGARRWLNKGNFAWLIVLIVVIYSVWNTGQVNSKLADNQSTNNGLIQEVAQSQNCTESFLNNVVTTLNERTAYTGPVNAADLTQNLAFAKAFDYALNTPQSKQDPDYSKALFTDYFKKLSMYLNLRQKSDSVQRANPYPENTAYRACLDSKKKVTK